GAQPLARQSTQGFGQRPGRNPNDLSQVPGMTGLLGINPNKKAARPLSLVERFKNLPPRTQVIYALFFGLIAFLVWEGPQEERPDVPPKTKTFKQDGKTPGGRTAKRFEELTPEQQRFVEEKYNLGFELYKSKDYDRSLYELRKIAPLIDGYKNSKEIERYA